MKVINGKTHKGQAMINLAKNNEGIILNDIYESYSPVKDISWRENFYKCVAEHGKNFHICSHNTFQYTLAWETEKGVRIETAKNSYLITC